MAALRSQMRGRCERRELWCGQEIAQLCVVGWLHMLGVSRSSTLFYPCTE